MHTQEERAKAVYLFIECGFSHAAVKAELGYPARATLDRWYADYLDKGYVKEKREHWEKFTDEEKARAVDACIANGGNVLKTTRQLGYPSRTLLSSWMDEMAPGLRKKDRPHVERSEEEQMKAVVSAYAGDGKPVSETIREAGVDKVTFYNWRRKLLGEDAQKVVDGLKSTDLPDDVGELQEMIEAQRRELHRLQLETAVWQGAAELVKKDPGVDPKNLTNREKAILVGALRGRFALKELLEAVGLAKSSYFYQVHAMEAPDKYAELREAVAGIFRESNATWGYRRIWGALRTADEPVVVSEKVVRNIMREDDLVVIYHAKKKNWSSYKGEESPAPPNLVGRDFSAGLPNFLWLTDITQFTLPRFKCYLSPVIDCFDGAVVSWTASRNPNAELVNTMLDDAISTLSPGERPVLHNDRGIHYRWPGWIDRCEAAGITRSMSKKGCSPDNSACEGFFGRLKNEFFYYRSWEGVTFEEFVAELGAYIEYYNEGRIKQSLGWKSPMQYRRELGLAA